MLLCYHVAHFAAMLQQFATMLQQFPALLQLYQCPCCNYISDHVPTILVGMLQEFSAMLPLYQWPCCNIISDPCWGVCDRMNGSCRRWCDIIKYLLWLILSGHWSSCQDAHTQFYSLLLARLQRLLVVNITRVDHLSSLTFHMMGIWKKCKTVICHTVW